MLACEQDNLEIVEILLEHNAGIEIQTLVIPYCTETFQFVGFVYTGWLDSSDDSLY